MREHVKKNTTNACSLTTRYTVIGFLPLCTLLTKYNDDDSHNSYSVKCPLPGDVLVNSNVSQETPGVSVRLSNRGY